MVRALQGRWDPFEPIALLSVAFTVLFVVVPVAHILLNDWYFVGWDIRHGFDGALLIALIGVASIYTGYIMGTGCRLGRRLKPFSAEWTPRSALRAGLTITFLGLALFAGFAAQAGGIHAIWQFSQGRSTADNPLLAHSSAYLYLGIYLGLPAGLLLLETRARHPSPSLTWAAALALGPMLAVSLGRGNRTYLLLLALSLIALPYLRTGRRPRVVTILAIGVLGFVLTNYLGANRYVGGQSLDSMNRSSAHTPAQQAKVFLLGPDPAMFSVLALVNEVTPDQLPYHPGTTLFSTLAAPVPGPLWPGKPQDGSVYTNQYLWPQQAAVTRAGNAPSMFGGFFYDSGYVGVIAYSVLIGIALRAGFEWFRANWRDPGVRLVYAASLPLVVNLIRAAPSDTISRAGYVVLPLIIFLWIHSRRNRPSSKVDG